MMIDFKLDPKSGVPFYRQIIDQIRYGVATGSLNVGEQLPTVRALAVQLKVNLNTVSKAYRELEIQKVLETQQGTGTFIGSLDVQISLEERQNKLAGICTEYLSIAASYGFSIDEMINELKQRQGGDK
ncbi:Transcriptional regulator, GntR family [Olavius sp. associated proteobacterium Delta 1]|nr:Transcriptional regulator, GntR family [Olavius sp. associated proteobacterium Delta 1]